MEPIKLELVDGWHGVWNTPTREVEYILTPEGKMVSEKIRMPRDVRRALNSISRSWVMACKNANNSLIARYKNQWNVLHRFSFETGFEIKAYNFLLQMIILCKDGILCRYDGSNLIDVSGNIIESCGSLKIARPMVHISYREIEEWKQHFNEWNIISLIPEQFEMLIK